MTKKFKIALITSVLAGSFSCTYAGWFSSTPKSTYDRALEAYGKNNNAEALGLYEQSCDEGNFESCSQAGHMYQHGNGGEQSNAKASELYTKACSGGYSGGCNNLQSIEELEGKTKEQVKCNNGNSQACRDLAIKFNIGQDGLAINYGKVTYYYSKACGLGDTYSCSAVEQLKQQNLRNQLLKENNYAKAYQAGLIDKDTARTEMLKRGQIIQAYEAKLIDKDTADLYLQKQAMDNATRAAEQQTDATRRAGMDAQFANSPNILNQQLQNINNNYQMNQMLNQQNINNNMRRYY